MTAILENDLHELIVHIYREFNARNIDAVLAHMRPDVDWPNGMEGGRVHGYDEVHAYWTRQWGILDPRVDPVEIQVRPDGRVDVEVHQVVHDLAGTLLVDTIVHHIYTFSDGLIARMDIE